MTQTYASPSSNLISIGFHALSESLRIQILELLREQELGAGELCESLQVSQSKLSFHLKVLKDAGLVHTRHAGRWSFYSLNLPQFVVLEQYLAEYRRLGEMLPTHLPSTAPKS